MATSTTSFAVADGNLAPLLSALTDLGFAPEPGMPVTLTLLDTFDGRLQRAGLRLTLHEGREAVLVLAGDDTVEARLPISARPKFVSDLPPGPFRSRLSQVVDVRALLSQMMVSATRTALVKRGANDGVVVTATVYSSLTLVDHDADTNAPAEAGADGDAVPSATVELAGVHGNAKPLRQTIDALAGLVAEPVDGDTLALVAGAAGIHTSGFTSSATVPLDPDMPAVEGYRLVLANLTETIEANWDGTVAHVDPEFLHDLRVAVRRIRTVLAEGKNVLPESVSEQARDRFRRLGALTGPARDLDVYLIEWDRYTTPLGATTAAALEPVRALLAKRQAAAHKELDASLRSRETKRWEAAWRRALVDLTVAEPRGAHADRALGNVVASRIDRAQERLVDHGRAITPSSPAQQVHDLRKDAKKLRYLLECFGSILPARANSRFVKRLKALQENLGEHQDAEVHVELVREVATVLHERGAKADTLVALGRLAERLDQIRVAARAEFANRFSVYDTVETQRALDRVVEKLRR